jgi:hypothetical protein
VKSLALFLAVVLIGQVLCAQANKPWNVDRLCGRTQYVKRTQDPKRPNNYSDLRKDLEGISLELYESNEGIPCCEAHKVSSTTISGKSGRFEFKPDHAGNYWLVAHWNNRDYRIPVNYQPQKRSSTDCSAQGIQIEDDGDSSWWATVTVD